MLELLHGAGRGYRTVRGVVRHWTHLALAEKAIERWQDRLEEARAGHSGGTTLMMVGASSAEAAPTHHEIVVRFWSEPPSRLREEIASATTPNQLDTVTVRDGASWWTYSADWGAVSNVGAGEEAARMSVGGGELWGALLAPAHWIPALDFELRGETEFAERRALEVRATPRPQLHTDVSFHLQLPAGADAYDLIVDRERGVALRIIASIEDDAFSMTEFEELMFDEDLPADTFVFEPPPGEEIRPPDVQLHEPLAIEEAARRASFPVFIVAHLPDGRWQMHVTYVEPRERPPMKEAVLITYHRADATHTLMLNERRAGEGEPDWIGPGVEMHQVEREGRTFTVYRPKRRYGMPLTIALECDGASIHLSSPDLEEEVLLELAASLTPVPSASGESR